MALDTQHSTPLRLRRRLGAIAVLAPALLAACHSDDDGTAGAGSTGTTGGLDLAPATAGIRAGEVEDFTATLPGGGTAVVMAWDLISGPGGALVDLGVPGTVRFLAGAAGNYQIRATDDQGRTGTLGFPVSSAAATLTVTEVVAGSDLDDVDARFDAEGGDLYIVDRIGDASAPQRLARASLAGDREAEVVLADKAHDIAAFGASGCVVLSPTGSLTDALRRYDRDLVEIPGFAAPALGVTESWAPRVAIDPTSGEIVLATSVNGGSLLFLDASGAPAGGSLQSSFVPSPVASPVDVVDLTVDSDGAVYVATEDDVARVLPDGTIDTANWAPAGLSEIVALGADDNGVLFVLARDQNAGQTGSLRKLDWRGQELGVLTEFSTGAFFAPRQFIEPLDLATYGDGSWRVYDDTQALDPANPLAAWLIAGELAPKGGAPGGGD